MSPRPGLRKSAGSNVPVDLARPTPVVDDTAASTEELNALLTGRLPELLGIRIIEASPHKVVGALTVRENVLAPNGYLHAATVVGLADTMCGIGARLRLPTDALGFTTVELKTNYLGTARQGIVTATARPVHSGRQTQVWDASVHNESAETIALFRCTQLMLYPS